MFGYLAYVEYLSYFISLSESWILFMYEVV